MTRSDHDKATINGLRELADFLDNHPLIPVPYIGTCCVFLTPVDDRTMREQIADLIRHAPGKWNKASFEPYFAVTRRFTGGVTIQLTTEQERVCERVVVERVEVPEEVVPAKTIPAHIEEKVEWRCPGSILRPDEPIPAAEVSDAE